MVSFSCEGCGDVLTKKKLDGHRNQCYGASFTCLDCMVHFQGTEYRAHTSCMSEAQKYQGHLYRPEKEKKGKNQNQQRQSKAMIPMKASVEEVPDENTGVVSVIETIMPEAPTPPSAAPDFVPNVFDFLVGSETPNQSTLNLVERAEAEENRMIEDTPSQARLYDDQQAEGMVIQYGNGPVSTQTPAPKQRKQKEKESKSTTKDKKRKRLHVDTSPQRPEGSKEDADEEMADADAVVPILHSGLTGGLNRLLSNGNTTFPPSPDYSGDNNSPASPLKRTKRTSKRESKQQTKKPTSNMLTNTIAHLFSSSDSKSKEDKSLTIESLPRKSRDRSSRQATSASSSQQIVPYNSTTTVATINPMSRAELFLSGITKGEESEKGYSVNKALKRYHRERLGKLGAGGKKDGEEKELWKCLRLRRNDRGEVVVFYAE